MKTMNYIVCIIGLFFANNGFSQYQDISSAQLFSVEEILKNAPQLDKTDVLVKIEGYIIERVNVDTYWFQDATDKIQVEIEKYLFPGFQFERKAKFIIVGEVDYDALEGVDIEVEFIQHLE